MGTNLSAGISNALEYKTLTPVNGDNDFTITYPSAGIINFNLPDADGGMTLKRGVVNTGTQSFAGDKEFKGKLSISSGTITAPSFVFAAAPTTGFSYNTASGYNKALISFPDFNTSGTSVLRFAFRQNGSFNLTNSVTGDYINGQGLDINILHIADNVPTPIIDYVQDGGVNVSTFAGTYSKTGTFGGRTASGNPGDEDNSTLENQALVEFIGKGWADGNWEHTNRIVFGGYAAEDHTASAQGAYILIKTTQLGTTGNHPSMLIDQAGNAGLTYLSTGLFASTPSTTWGGTVVDRFFSIEGVENGDAGLFIQNSTGSRGMNIWLDYTANAVYFDNVRNNPAAIIQTRLRSTIGTPVVAITTGVDGSGTYGFTNFGTDAIPDNTFTVGSTSQFQIDLNGKIVAYPAGTLIGNGDLLIGTGTGNKFEKGAITASNGTKVTNGGGTIALETDINGLTADVTPDESTDYIMSYDASGGANKKVLMTNIGNNTIFTATGDGIVSNTTTPTTLIGAGVGSLTINANTLVAGKSYIIKMYGYMNTLASPGNLTVETKLNSIVVATTTAVAAPTSLTNRRVEIETIITCRTTGVTGTVMAQGSFQFNNNTTAGLTREMLNMSTVTINTTTNQAIDVTMTWSTASTSNNITITNATIEIIN
ncbi:MAG: hypothetical protein KBF51_14075 [Chitinophagales bacterium]|nr:hypothetical protein [Chitinophagales bacterium]MBP9797181.1 hypothetical protein [Chitinophagales bacterium]